MAEREVKVSVEGWSLFWAVSIFCMFVFARGCGDSPSNFDYWLKAHYGYEVPIGADTYGSSK